MLVFWAAVYVCPELGVSDLVIGLTVGRVGTSLPELGVQPWRRAAKMNMT